MDFSFFHSDGGALHLKNILKGGCFLDENIAYTLYTAICYFNITFIQFILYRLLEYSVFHCESGALNRKNRLEEESFLDKIYSLYMYTAICNFNISFIKFTFVQVCWNIQFFIMRVAQKNPSYIFKER